MGLILADVGADCFLKARFNNTWPSDKNLYLKLYTNNITLTDALTAASFTIATGGGYADKTLTCGSWTITPANDPSDAVYAIQTFTFTGALSTNPTIYGYIVVDGDGVYQWGEALDAPYTPASNGDVLNITPKFQMSKGTPT